MVPSPEDPVPPTYCPTPGVLDDLELLRLGVLDEGFGRPPAPYQLHAPGDVVASARRAGALELTDAEGTRVATVSVQDTYEVDGQTSGIIGTPRDFADSPPRPFADLYLTPGRVFDVAGADALSVPVTGALTESDVREIRAESGSRPVVLLALAGHGTPDKLTAAGLIRATVAAADLLPDAHVVAVPAASRGNSSADGDFYAQVAAAWAPGEVMWPAGHGDVPPPVCDVVEHDRPRGLRQGVVIFLTGLSGSGKSTIAQHLQNRLLESGQRTVSLLDGDRVRRHLSRGLGFSKEDREINIDRIGWVAAEIAAHGGVAICSPIAPFDATRKSARAMAEDNGGAFVLVHVSTPLAECERRDRKGLYAKARRGEIGEFTGISSPYEEPADADLSIDTTGIDIEAGVVRILDVLRSHGWIAGSADSPGAHA